MQSSTKLHCMLTDVFHTYTHLFPFPVYGEEHTLGATGKQRMLTPLLYLILHLIVLELCVCSAFVLYFSFKLLILITVNFHHLSSLYAYTYILRILYRLQLYNSHCSSFCGLLTQKHHGLGTNANKRRKTIKKARQLFWVVCKKKTNSFKRFGCAMRAR